MENKNDQAPNKGHEHARQPDPGTLGTTDPQEHMEGPVSSMMQRAKKGAEKNDNKAKEAAKHEHKQNTTGGDFINE